MLGIESMLAKVGHTGFSMAIHRLGGEVTKIGRGEPAFRLYVRNEAGERALGLMAELPICEAYIRGDLDMEGDVVRALSVARDLLSDDNLWIRAWRRLEPLLVGRTRLNPKWIALHYDSKNIQLHAVEREYDTYTPGIYESDDDSMEDGARRKLAFAFANLGLKAGDRVLDVGCGWGGFTRFSARLGVRVVGITLSRDQLAYTQQKVREEGLDAEAHYQDFFTFEPPDFFDGISMMGVIEDLSDYPKVVERVARWVKPGGRIYLDFASSALRFGTSSFVTKYVWPGTFRMVYLPELVQAIVAARLEIFGLYNDRRNYHLWAKKGHQRWLDNREAIIAESSAETWRLFHLLFAGTSAVMDSASHEVSAYRMVLERPGDLSFRR